MKNEIIEVAEPIACKEVEEFKLTANERRMLELEWQRQSNITSKEGAECYIKNVMSIKNERKRHHSVCYGN
jgi:hypothetical protein